jgi:glucan biosynthesis protein C
MKPEKPRLFYVDNLRILLIILVVLHHLAITYGAPGYWPYREGRPDMFAAIVFTLFVAVNQAFFMGFFYMISGYFVPGSYDRKGPRAFLGDRLLRLGIPVLFYIIVIDPVLVYALAVNVKGFEGSFREFLARYLENYSSLGVGPLWFIELLLIFNIAYMLWRRLAKPAQRTSKSGAKMPGNRAVAIFALILGLVTFTVRIWLPRGWVFEPLSLQFPDFPQYISLFAIGVIASRRNWFQKVSEEMGRFWLKISVILVGLLPVMIMSGRGNIAPFFGGIHWQSLVAALWEQFFCMGIIICLLVWFRKRFNRQGSLAKAMSASAYTVFIIHSPVLIFLGLALRGVGLYPLVKFALLAPVAVSFCFLAANYIRKLPLARRIL